ncbi:Ketosteroid isomerase homolog [Ferrimonas sediminum]|uniref:Ketosteroid isomerase homolog n=1 Tax=Ferrimonas sediminum TaxID=718193 RepID=A0A1G8NMS5_9GAMM|nr:hypothetical protein [Ferrimonas sediminum]SDI80790.1 Ketosteroid isomerase homolog [Ferrimonas sediminum]
MHHHALINALKASQNWINQFNHGNLDYCVASYTEGAQLEVIPMGRFEGRKAIREFWQGIMQSGAADLCYRKTWLKLIDDNNVQLGSEWSMNIGHGVITLEQWQRQADGHWKLTHDAFEILEQY